MEQSVEVRVFLIAPLFDIVDNINYGKTIMNKILFILFLTLSMSKYAYATDITIEVSDIKNVDGTIYISLCNQ